VSVSFGRQLSAASVTLWRTAQQIDSWSSPVVSLTVRTPNWASLQIPSTVDLYSTTSDLKSVQKSRPRFEHSGDHVTYSHTVANRWNEVGNWVGGGLRQRSCGAQPMRTQVQTVTDWYKYMQICKSTTSLDWSLFELSSYSMHDAGTKWHAWQVDRIENKGWGQSKESQKCYISRSWGEPSAEPSCLKICMWGDVPDIITCAKFQNKILRGCDSTGSRIFHFPIDFWMTITTVACDLE